MMSYLGVETMSKNSVILFPKTAAMLKQLGENIRLARLRRNVTARLTAERAGIRNNNNQKPRLSLTRITWIRPA